MFKSFFLNKRWVLWAWGGAILLILSLLIQVSITVKINEWYKGFYDLLQNAAKSNISEFWEKIYVFSYLAFPYVLLATFTSFFTRVFALRWREAITFDYLPFWKSSDASVEGASQRIQEDASRFAKIVESLGLQVVRAIMTLIAFIPILWGLSSGIEIEFLKQLPGSLVWVSLFSHPLILVFMISFISIRFFSLISKLLINFVIFALPKVSFVILLMSRLINCSFVS